MRKESPQIFSQNRNKKIPETKKSRKNQSPCALPLRDRGDPAGKVGGLTSTLSVTRTNETSKSCCGEFLRCWVTPFTKVHYDLMSSGNQGGKLLIVGQVFLNFFSKVRSTIRQAPRFEAICLSERRMKGRTILFHSHKAHVLRF